MEIARRFIASHAIRSSYISTIFGAITKEFGYAERYCTKYCGLDHTHSPALDAGEIWFFCLQEIHIATEDLHYSRRSAAEYAPHTMELHASASDTSAFTSILMKMGEE